MPGMSLLVAGKRSPDPDALADAASDGFERVELYLERRHLDAFDETLSVCRRAAVDVASVHTPHVGHDEVAYFRRADDLADALDAVLVVHSTRTNLVAIPEILDATDFDAPFGFENSTGHSEFHVRNAVLDAGHDLVLDTAHLYTAEREYLDSLERLLGERGDRIPVVHCCDGRRLRDGLAFGEGSMDMRAVVAALRELLDDALVVLEVPTDRQGAALERYESLAAEGESRASETETRIAEEATTSLDDRRRGRPSADEN
jgi:sugar phosphate isomerase/epimerase